MTLKKISKNGQNNKKKNMNNQGKLATQTKTRSKTKIITGIVIAVLVIVGLGTAIFFAVNPAQTKIINFSDEFQNADNLVLEDGIAINADQANLYTSDANFRRQLISEDTNFICPGDLKDKIATIEVTGKHAYSSEELKPDLENDVYREKLGVKINGQEINTDSNTAEDIQLVNYFHNFPNVKWSHLLRWQSTNPSTMLVLNNGTIIPVSKGETNIKVAICGIVSEEDFSINLGADEAEMLVFNNITALSGIGTAISLFQDKFTNHILVSKEITSLDDKFLVADNMAINKIEGKLYTNFDNGKNIKLLFSFDNGDTWTLIDNLILHQEQNLLAPEKYLSFSQDISQENARHLRWMVIYEFNENMGELNDQLDTSPLLSVLQGLVTPISGIEVAGQNKKAIFVGPNNSTQLNIGLPANEIGNRVVAYSHHLIRNTSGDGTQFPTLLANNPGITNFQQGYPLGLINSFEAATIVALPGNLEILKIDLSATAEAKAGCSEGQELVAGKCTIPLPPNGGDAEQCNDDFRCPEGQLRQSCLKECLGPEPLICNKSEILIKDNCQSVLHSETDSALMVNPRIIYRGDDRVIIFWKVGKDEYKNKELQFKYGTFDPNNLQKDADNKVILEDFNNATVHYNEEEDYYYAVLKNLKGGELVDKNDAGFIDGRKPYAFQISLGENYARPTAFKTLNRFQTILYYYNLVLSENFNLENYEQVDDSLRGGGSAFYYKPEGQEPLSLRGVHFTLLNDRQYEEFNNRISATAKKYGNKKTVEELYKRVHDRIYDDNLGMTFDKAGVDYWTKQVERKDDNRIDILGAKFAISVSPEATGDISKMALNEQKVAKADLSYEVVLRRGGDQKGIENLMTLANTKEMRQKLAMSREYDDRLNSISDRRAQIEELYETLYARAADVAGVDYWDNTGESIQEIKREFLNSADFSRITQ